MALENAQSTEKQARQRSQRRRTQGRWVLAALAAAALLIALSPTLLRAAQRNADSVRGVAAIFDDDPATRPPSGRAYLAGFDAFQRGDLVTAESFLSAAAQADSRPACRLRLLAYAEQHDWAATAALPPICTVPEQFDAFLQRVAANWQPPPQPAPDAVDPVDAVLARASSPGIARAAMVLAAAGETLEVERWTRAVLAREPNDAATMLLGRSLYAQGRFAEAARELERHVVAQPDDSPGWYWLARAQAGIARDDLAVDSYARALDTSAPDDVRRVYYWSLLAASQARLGACDQARTSFATAETVATKESRGALAQIGAEIRSLCP